MLSVFSISTLCNLYSVEMSAFFCYTCSHLNKNYVFADQLSGKVVLTDCGIKKWKGIRAILTQHRQRQKHINTISQWVNYLKIPNQSE